MGFSEIQIAKQIITLMPAQTCCWYSCNILSPLHDWIKQHEHVTPELKATVMPGRRPALTNKLIPVYTREKGGEALIQDLVFSNHLSVKERSSGTHHCKPVYTLHPLHRGYVPTEGNVLLKSLTCRVRKAHCPSVGRTDAPFWKSLPFPPSWPWVNDFSTFEQGAAFPAL